MFAHAFFPSAFFAPVYYPPTGAAPPPTPKPIPSTPGFLWHAGRTKHEDEAEKLERHIREWNSRFPDPVRKDASREYLRKSALLAKSIARLEREAAASEAAIEALLAKRQTEKIEREIMLQRQALLLAQVQRAVFLEEMEVIDIAYITLAVMTLH